MTTGEDMSGADGLRASQDSAARPFAYPAAVCGLATHRAQPCVIDEDGNQPQSDRARPPGGSSRPRQLKGLSGRVVVLRRSPTYHLWAATVRIGDERVLPIGPLQVGRRANRAVARRQRAACGRQQQ